MKKILSLILTVALVLCAVSCSFIDPLKAKEKEFGGSGLTITLTEGFVEREQEGYTLCFDSSKVAVLALKEPFTLAPGFENYTVRDYAELLVSANKDKAGNATVKTKSGLGNSPYFEYTFRNPEEDVVYYYLTVAYKASDAFWMIQFCCKEASKEECEQYFEKWMKSVEFD